MIPSKAKRFAKRLESILEAVRQENDLNDHRKGGMKGQQYARHTFAKEAEESLSNTVDAFRKINVMIKKKKVRK